MKFDTQNDLCEQYLSKRVVILLATKCIHYKCLQIRFVEAVLQKQRD